MSQACTLAVITVSLLLSLSSPARGEVYIVGHPAHFDLFEQAPAIPIPHAGMAFPGATCGTGDRGPRGVGSMAIIPFGANSVTITGGTGSPLCLFDGGMTLLPYNGDRPNSMPPNIPVQDRVKDVHLAFHHPVQAVAFWLLTGNEAREVATFKDAAGKIIDKRDIHRFTLRNGRAFVGFVSRIPFTDIELSIPVGQPGQNQGIQAMRIAETVAFPSKQLSER